MAKLVRVTTLSESDCQNFISVLAQPRGEDGVDQGRFAKLHELVRTREHHFYNTEEADQKLPEPHGGVEPFQTDILRRTWVEMKSRLTENPVIFNVRPPRDTKSQREAAADMGRVFTAALSIVQERTGTNLLGDLADGMIIDCFGVLHWRKAAEIWPTFPDLDEVEELPEDLDERRRFTDEPTSEGTFIETEASRLERDRVARARAGFPYHFEAIRPDQFSFIEDISMDNGMAMALVLRRVPLIEYNEKIRDSDDITISLMEEEPGLRIHMERESTTSGDPSDNVSRPFTQEILVAQLWTRNEFYELAAKSDGTHGAGAFQLVKSFDHPYGMPPFAIARGLYSHHPDPALAYSPLLEGLFRLKPFYDKDRTLARAILEQIALPFYWIKLADGAYMMDDEGTRVVLSKNALASFALPAGATLEKVDFTLDPAYLGMLEFTGEELKEAAPDSGFVEVGASTQPWTIRLAQDQANVQVKQAKKELAQVFRVAFRNIAKNMSDPAEDGGLGRRVDVYARIRKGQVEEETRVGVEPEDIISLEIDVDIDPNSSAQVIANIEHGRVWLADPNVPLTTWDFLRDFWRDDQPEETIESWTAEQVYKSRIQPQVIEQELARRFGSRFITTPDLRMIGPNGVEATPDEVLSTNGINVDRSVQAEGAATPPDLPPIGAPGTTTQPGLPG